MSAFSDLWTRIKKGVKKLFKGGSEAVVEFFERGISIFAQAVPALALEIIKDAVLAAELQGGDGSTKRERVLNSVKENLKEYRITISNSLINTAIEIAVQALKNNK